MGFFKVFQTCDPAVQQSRILTYIGVFIALGFLMLCTMFLQVNFIVADRMKITMTYFRVFCLLYPVKH